MVLNVVGVVPAPSVKAVALPARLLLSVLGVGVPLCRLADELERAAAPPAPLLACVTDVRGPVRGVADDLEGVAALADASSCVTVVTDSASVGVAACVMGETVAAGAGEAICALAP